MSSGQSWSLNELLETCFRVPEVVASELSGIRVSNVQIDSRKVSPGDLFIALPGLQSSAEKFVMAAVECGAVAVLCAREGVDFNVSTLNGPGGLRVPCVFGADVPLAAARLINIVLGAPSKALDVIGVTGTNGKTSVTQYTAQLLSMLKGTPQGVMGTLGYGLSGNLEDVGHTTADLKTNHEQLANLRAKGAEYVAMEVSSHALEQGRIAGVVFDGAVFTNLTRDHLDYHGTMESYGNAKARLFDIESVRWAVINLDDPFAQSLLVRDSVRQLSRVITFGIQSDDADLIAVNLKSSAEGIEGDLSWQGQIVPFQTALLGQFNVSNVLAATACVLQCGYDLLDIVPLLPRLQAVAGRMEPVAIEGVGYPRAIVDYAHTPDALENALQASRKHTDQELWCVFGCGGDRDAGKRSEMGKVASELADKVIVTSDNPRSECPQRIIDDILHGTVGGAVIQVEQDRALAIRKALFAAHTGDVVLVAGKGHEPYQEIKGSKFVFSDRDEILKSLHERAANSVNGGPR
ncbi:UDP-N-acetylmuramyl tripeptide synthetase [Oleiphilus messinensis]|uniref:UDP-N-acetylmuramoyl-L-alanyl-D-glutamate--2,6-diaminopimelate ligase n=1 Tax=Oleiphilus messinensis TaxID=141451 RepID=A0A1Y0IDV1_9GAMM|nr:UDP-N-acetylmuramoyl-L-alanyl-D-glutamate--2,6-diaminopimelate ligase [Oleiphilus messinensis]ARU58697.1 UDP-N-acetylmuramyl tripeptide synthetase [Oleiphilus messinensis]